MPKTKSFLRVFTESGPLVALAVALALLVGIAAPASAQFFNFGNNFGGPQRPPPPRGGGYGGGGGWFGGDFFAPFQQQAPKKVIREDFSKAPPPEKRESAPKRNVLLLGDAMADWLAYGLEDAYAERPDMGVIRKHKTVSGLIKYQPKGDPADWPAAAKGILPTEKPDAIVVMLGLNDRMAMREPVVEKPDSKSADKKTDKKDAKAKPEAKPGDQKSGAKPGGATDTAAKPDDKVVDTELSPDDAADNSDAPPATTPEKSARSPNGLYEFREERWVELYTRKIDELIGVMKSKGVPVLWVGLPAVRDANALPGQPAPRPLAGPILPLVASSVGTDQLLGGSGSRPAAVDALAARTLVKGEPLAPPAGRADDFAWPRREVGREQAKGETPSASGSPDGTAAAPGAPAKPKKPRPVQSSSPPLGNLFGFGNAGARQWAPPPRAPNVPRPPGNVGRSAWLPGFFGR